MRRAAMLCVLACGLLAPATSFAAVQVFGLSHSALGAATVALSGSAATGYALQVDNLGSSGNDGVSIVLPGANGVVVTYGAPALHTQPIIHRDLAARALISGVVTTLATARENAGALGLDVWMDIPGATTIQISAYRAKTPTYNGHPTVLKAIARMTGGGATLDQPGVTVTVAARTKLVDGVTVTTTHMVYTRPAEVTVTVDGVTFLADRIEFDAPLSASSIRCVSAEIHATSGPGTVTNMAINTTGLQGTGLKRGTRTNVRGRGMSALSGIVLDNAGGTGPQQRIRVSAPAADPDAAVISLWGLPPGVPATTAALTSLQVSLDPTTVVMGTGQSLQFAAHTFHDPNNGLPPYDVTHHLTITRSGATAYDFSAVAGSPATTVHYELYRGPRQTVSLDGTYSPRATDIVRSQGVLCSNGRLRYLFGLRGTALIAGGVTYACDSLVVVFDDPTDVDAALLDEKWTLSHGMALTILGEDGTDTYSEVLAGGRKHKAWLCSNFRFELGRIHMDNFAGVDGDGISVDLNALGNVSIPFDGGLALAPGEHLQGRAETCDDGSCGASSTFELSGFALGAQGIKATHGQKPQFICLPNGPIVPPAELDVDGDGYVDVRPLPGLSAAFASIRYRWVGPYSACWEFEFKSPVKVFVSGQLRILDSSKGDRLQFWGNRGGLPIVPPTPVPASISLNGLPPGCPVPCFTSVTLDDPGLESAGIAIGDPGVNGNIAGRPTTPTWSTPTGIVLAADLDGDGAMDLTRPYASGVVNSNTATTVSGTVVLRTAPPPLHCHGYVTTAAFDSLPPLPDTTSMEVHVAGTVDGAALADMASVTYGGGGGAGGSSGTVFVRCATASVMGAAQCDIYSAGVLQASIPYPGDMFSDLPPLTILLEADTDGDGSFDIECVFSPGNHMHILGTNRLCDRLRVHNVGAAHPVTSFAACSLRLNGLPPGVPVTGTRLAAIVAPTASLSTPGDAAPAAFALSPPWPNPTLAASALRFSLPAREHVRASVLDLAGREVVRLADEVFAAGEHTLRWNGLDPSGTAVSPGLYFVRVQREGGAAQVTRLTRLK